MSRLSGWLRGSTPRTSTNPSPAGSQTDLRAAEIANIEDAMTAAAKLMNDDMDGAEEDLRKGNSAFHSMGLGITTFMRSVLGFEKEIMTEASNRLNECESVAWNEQKKATKNNESTIYPPGSEYALAGAEAQLMGAMVGVLHESLTEALKGFYKLRKAYMTLDGLMQAEAAYLKQRGTQLSTSQEVVTSKPSTAPVAKDASEVNEDDDLEFVEAPESLADEPIHTKYEGHLSGEVDETGEKLGGLTIAENGKLEAPAPNGLGPKSLSSGVITDQGPDSDIFTNPVDIFIHSGTNMCFGILLLMISMVPPAFSRLLSIIGFRGDRERGIKMLWQSTRFNNINGAVSGLVLLSYYNGILGFADILPTEADAADGAIVGQPRRRCEELLANMIKTYPESRLWRFEVARGLSGHRDIPGAIEILQRNTDSKMRQVVALNNFELSLDTMFVGDHPAMRDNFLRCVELNDWSHALYYYMAGCAELELYRDAYHTTKGEKDGSRLAAHAKKAEELIRKAPTVAGKKRFMSRPLPFEQFVLRKVQKWEERAKELKVDFIDAVGVSPVQEMVYLWNGSKKMGDVELERAAGMLDWDRLTASEEAKARIRAEKDEGAVAHVCRAAIYRVLERLDESRALCEEVMSMDKLAFKGPSKDDYPQPAATYEMAVLAWSEVQRPELRKVTTKDSIGGDSVVATEKGVRDWRRKKTEECEAWLNKVAKWEAYVLDARIGMRVQTGLDTLRWFKRENGWDDA